MDNDKLKDALTGILKDVAEQAKADAKNGKSNIGSIFKDSSNDLVSLDGEAINEAIANIEKATKTKQGAKRLLDGIMLAARTAARIAL